VPESDYEEMTVDLQPGDRVYFHSDGINEEQSPNGEEYGRARLTECLAAAREMPLDKSLDTLVEAIIAWRGNDAFGDDISILALERVS
jgi:sigma-B regulation protein RsbU (phosphoserine phosphatase)